MGDGPHENREGAPPSLRRAGTELVAVSFVVLFLELTLIRWIPSQIRVAAYFPNLILIAAFLGLGVGCLRKRGGSGRWAWPLTLLLTVGACLMLSRVAFTANEVSDHLWLLYYDLPEGTPVVDSVRLPLVFLFVATAGLFFPLGRIVASRLEVFRRHSRQLWGYAADLLGSLAGVVGFAVAALLGSSPLLWFGACLAAAAIFLVEERRHAIGYAVIGMAVVLTVQVADAGERYSPYYALSTAPLEDSPDVAVMANGSLHQIARHLSKRDPILSRLDSMNRVGYHYPFDRLREVPRRALVLGAGTGNDVAVLLDHGVEEIDVVEIDPVIVEVGREMHPNRPYDSPGVSVFETDARSFLNDTDRTYDLIVFGTLDSMTRLSALSNVRLDNFVYTREGLRAARDRLADDGGLVMYFMVGKQHIHDHILALLTGTFGRLPVVQQGDYALFNVIYMSGPAFSHLRTPAAERAGAATAARFATAPAPTDDWPYLYLESRSVSPFYLSLIALFLALAAGGVLWASKSMRAGLAGAGRVDAEMFLFGLAFLLMETRFVTAMNLVWGSTWITSAVVFGSILAMVLLATIFTELRPLPFRMAALGLVVSLVAVYLVPVGLLVGRSPTTRLALSAILIGVPLFFASVCFALRFKGRQALDVAFGWNLLGAVAGGLLEFASMWLGFRTLLLVALVAYLAVILARERAVAPRPLGRPREAVPAPQT